MWLRSCTLAGFFLGSIHAVRPTTNVWSCARHIGTPLMTSLDDSGWYEEEDEECYGMSVLSAAEALSSDSGLLADVDRLLDAWQDRQAEADDGTAKSSAEERAMMEE